MRNFIASLVMFVSVISNAYAAGNGVYIDQIGNNSTVNVTQTGSGNQLGNSTQSTALHGDSQTVTIDQVGMNNVANVSIDGAGTSVTSQVNGNNNNVNINCGVGGSCGNSTLRANASGSGNSLSITSMGNSTSTIDVNGSNNQATISNTSGNLMGAQAGINILGDTNVVNVTQDGVAGINGHSATVSVTGGANNIAVSQGGTVDSTVNISSVGSGNTINVKSNHQ